MSKENETFKGGWRAAAFLCILLPAALAECVCDFHLTMEGTGEEIVKATLYSDDPQKIRYVYNDNNGITLCNMITMTVRTLYSEPVDTSQLLDFFPEIATPRHERKKGISWRDNTSKRRRKTKATKSPAIDEKSEDISQWDVSMISIESSNDESPERTCEQAQFQVEYEVRRSSLEEMAEDPYDYYDGEVDLNYGIQYQRTPSNINKKREKREKTNEIPILQLNFEPIPQKKIIEKGVVRGFPGTVPDDDINGRFRFWDKLQYRVRRFNCYNV